MIDTGIFIRAKVRVEPPRHESLLGTEERIESIDIGDPRLDAEQLLRWLLTLSSASLDQTMQLVRVRAEEEP